MPRIAYRHKNFKPTTLAIIQHANSIIADLAAQGLTPTLRQLYYQLVVVNAIPNTRTSYSNLGSVISDARLAGLIDWEAIEDRTRSLQKNAHWDDPAEIVGACAEQYAVDKWAGQRNRVEVWVEKEALVAVIGQAAKAWDCPYFACKGYTSMSEMWRAAMRFKQYRRNGQRPIIIHLGDHDPSGIDMTRDIDDRNNELFGAPVQVDRIALNMDQILKYNPPPNPAKVNDSRFVSYQAEHGNESWELDALEPAVLNKLIQKRIKKYLDLKLYKELLAEEEREKRLLQAVADRWDEVVDLVEE